jgi:hypothetical protein
MNPKTESRILKKFWYDNWKMIHVNDRFNFGFSIKRRLSQIENRSILDVSAELENKENMKKFRKKLKEVI